MFVFYSLFILHLHQICVYWQIASRSNLDTIYVKYDISPALNWMSEMRPCITMKYVHVQLNVQDFLKLDVTIFMY
jgi:hypothetical protein